VPPPPTCFGGLLQKNPEFRLTLDGVFDHEWVTEPEEHSEKRRFMRRYRGSYFRREVSQQEIGAAFNLPGVGRDCKPIVPGKQGINGGFGPPPGAAGAMMGLALPLGGNVDQPEKSPHTREDEAALKIGPLPKIVPDGSGCGWRLGGLRANEKEEATKVCNWAVPRRLLWGFHPCHERDQQATDHISSLHCNRTVIGL
jgi:hypothetical protein